MIIEIMCNLLDVDTIKSEERLQELHVSVTSLLNERKFEEALVSAQTLLKEARMEKRAQYVGIANYLIGASFYELTQYSLAIHSLKQAIEHFEQSHNDELFYVAMMMYGTCFVQMGEFQTAQEKYEHALNNAIRRKNIDLEIRTRNNIANIFSEMSDPKSALKQLEQCHQLAEQYNKHELLATILGNLAGNMGDLGKFDDSIAILRRALKLFKKNGDLHGEGRTFDMLSRMYLAKKDFEQSRACNAKSTALFVTSRFIVIYEFIIQFDKLIYI